MRRERALKVVLVLVGLLFCAGIYPLILMAKQEPALAMMMSLYVTLGIFLLIASRNPSAHRSLIAQTRQEIEPIAIRDSDEEAHVVS